MAQRRFDVIGFDADDTLWHSEDAFHRTEQRFVELVGPYAPEGVDVAAALRAMELAQLPISGYGVKAFTLSMVQSAVASTDGAITASAIAQIVETGMAMLTETPRLLPHVPQVLEDVGHESQRAKVEVIHVEVRDQDRVDALELRQRDASAEMGDAAGEDRVGEDPEAVDREQHRRVAHPGDAHLGLRTVHVVPICLSDGSRSGSCRR